MEFNSLLIFYSREKEMNEKYLRRIEEDQEREMRQLEEKIRKEVRLYSSTIFFKNQISFHRNNKNLNRNEN